MTQETSIRAQITMPLGGKVVTMGFPGLVIDAAGAVQIDPARLAATVNDTSLNDAKILVVLVELHELPENALALLEAACIQRDITLVHIPIEDYQPPNSAFSAKWRDLDPSPSRILAAGGTLGVSCHYGAGRSGVLAAALLIEQGIRPAESVKIVRRQFPDSIESQTQIDWLLAKSAGAKI